MPEDGEIAERGRGGGGGLSSDAADVREGCRLKRSALRGVEA
jgi:hypothetical protein